MISKIEYEIKLPMFIEIDNNNYNKYINKYYTNDWRLINLADVKLIY